LRGYPGQGKRQFPAALPFSLPGHCGDGVKAQTNHYCKHSLLAETCYYCQGNFVRNVTYSTTPPQQNYDLTVPPYTPKEITHRWKTKDILGVMHEDIFNRPNISGGGSILNGYDFKDRRPAFLFEGRPFDLDPAPQQELRFKDCSTCDKYSVNTIDPGQYSESYTLRWKNPQGEWVNSKTRFPLKDAVRFAEGWKEHLLNGKIVKTPKRILRSYDAANFNWPQRCETLCLINKKYSFQDRVKRKSDISYLYGSLLEGLATQTELTWQEMCSSSFIPPTTFECLTQTQNQIIQYRFKGKTHKEIATALSGGRARISLSVDKVKYHARKARIKLEQNKIFKRKKQHAPKIPPLPFKRVPKMPRLSTKVEREISKIDRKYGTDLRWWYNNRVKGKEYPLESLLTMSQEFWKKPVSIIKVSINPRTGFCYYPEDEKYKITEGIDNKAWKPFVADKDYKIHYDYGGDDTSDFIIETRKFNPKTKEDEQKDLTEIIK